MWLQLLISIPESALQWIVIALLPLVAISLYVEFFSPAKTFFLAVVILSIFGILTPQEILSGFANEQIANIMMLLIIGGILNKSSVLDILFKRLLLKVTSYTSFIFRMMGGVAGASAFINNTPIVAILIPYVYRWGKKNNIAASKLMIPLSYAAILGGTATLVGTSTNLLVNGLAVESGMAPLGIFDFSIVGLPLIFIGLLYIGFLGRKLLPSKRDPLESFSEDSRDYIVELRVQPKSELIGKSVQEAHLRHLKGLFLVEIIRNNRHIAPVSPVRIIKEGDILLFAGDVKTISELMDNLPGLTIPKASHLVESGDSELIEVIMPPQSVLVNQTVKECDFRSRYDASVVAIHRHGERLGGKIGNITLAAGDVLLLLAGSDFEKRQSQKFNFYVLSKIRDLSKLDVKRSLIVIIGLITAIIASATGMLSLFKGLILLMGVIVFTNIVSFRQLRDMLDTNLLVLAAFALSFGVAISKTGVADMGANMMIDLFSPLGAVGLLFAIYLVTNLLTEIMTNIAAASLSFPLAFAIAINMGLDPKPFVLAVAIAASASFMTPIGYQTNLMVYAPGGYKFRDFLTIGLPLTLLYMCTTILILSLHYGLI